MPKQNETTSQFFLGFDFGMKRIGVAIGQKLTGTATPLSTINAKKGTPHWEDITKIILQWRPCALVVGVPLHIDGTTQQITKAAQHFIEQIKKHYSLPVFAADERLTTRAAKEHLFGAGGYKALCNEPIDGFAAKIILESWMKENP
jgi:putative holliday junction resolvase